jgi:hypothetical protein
VSAALCSNVKKQWDSGEDLDITHKNVVVLSF